MLGPQLFTIFVNDIPHVVVVVLLFLLADDIQLSE